jgi:hypothetical protein
MKALSDTAQGVRDFGFLYGEWLVQGRRRREPLSGCDRWERFEAIQKCWPLFNGLGNVAEVVSEECKTVSASLRFFDPQRRRWLVYSLSSRDGLAEPPAQGRFRNGTGEFFREEQWCGSPVLVRERWLRTASAAPVWDRALSSDGGNTWEIDWTMELTRVDWPFECGLDTMALRKPIPDMAVSF